MLYVAVPEVKLFATASAVVAAVLLLKPAALSFNLIFEFVKLALPDVIEAAQYRLLLIILIVGETALGDPPLAP
jgi:hypothetical protein